MIINILCIALISLWALYILISSVRRYKKAKKAGVPMGCAGCGSLQNGTCASHGSCHTKEDVDKMVENAKAALAKKRGGCC